MNFRHLLTSFAIICTVTFGQTVKPFPTPTGPPPPFTSVPPVDRELYYQFYQWHLTQINANAAAKAAHPAQAASLDQQMAALLKVDMKELPAVIANTQSVTAIHARVFAKAAAGPNKSSRMTPAQQAAQLDFERIHATLSGAAALWQSLTPASWAGINGYIVGTFKTQIYNKTK